MDYRPWTWKVPENYRETQPSIRRQDAWEKVSGSAVYTRDITLPGMLYAKILTSPYAHARITRIDSTRAEALPGVRDVLRFTDPDIAHDSATGAWYEISGNYDILTLPGTADFFQHPMGVAITADSEEVCDRALRLLDIEWEEIPFILDMEESIRPDAPKIMADVRRTNAHAREPNTILTESFTLGDPDGGFAAADRVLRYKITREMNAPVAAEPAVCIAQWRGDFLDLWVHHHDIPHWFLVNPTEAREQTVPPLAEWSKITATLPYQGCMFGGFAWLAYSACFTRLAVILARRAGGRPIKLLYDESAHYCLGDDGGTYSCTVGAKKDGTITSAAWHVVGPRNALAEKTYEGTAIPNLRATCEWGLVNRGHQMCFRHGANSCVPHGVMFDRVAAEFGLDPTEVALRNDGCRGHDWDWVTRYQRENGFPERWSLREVIEKGKAAIDWDRKWHPPGTRKLPDGKMHGMGFMQVLEWTWQAPASAMSWACLMLRNGIVAIVGVRSDIGSDTESGARHIVASELGLKYEDTVIQERRSDNSSFYMWQPGGSFSTAYINTQLVMAARELKRKILEYAVSPTPAYNSSHFFKTAGPPAFPGLRPEELDIRDSFVFERARPENRKTLREVADIFWDADPALAHPVVGTVSGLTMDGNPDPTMYVMGRQAHFIEAAVDTETGMVDIMRIVCVNDVGHLFNPRGAQAQQYGGALMGLGRSATEEQVWCPRTGVGLNFDLAQYHIGTMNDYPPAECLVVESHLGYAAFGAFGIGENVGAAMSGITASAIYNATGKWVSDYPTTPDRVLRALGRI
ncbi:MAG: molybdopterin-dependent oxidoreductase [Acidobacteriota bacterium]|jgi:xanthine dehydrogenase molybdenum-binding subunit|nr:molybdopterin-dependent oxidoreductase [Acidobacteriota bacterium]NLT31852.1 molybdopterin-dependent oxidoreductase [Acidobacteriota bacterium]